MKTLVTAGILSAALVSPAAFAQAKNFEGFGLRLSTGFQNNEIKTSDLTENGARVTPRDASESLEITNDSKAGMPLNIGISYTFALTERLTLGALVEYNPISMNAGSSDLILNGVQTSDGRTNKLENQVSLSIMPGYAFTDTTMGYARVGWINATAKSTLSSGPSSSANTNGILLGLGAKHLFTPNIYGFAEATYASYNGETATSQTIAGDTTGVTLTPESYSFLIGVGYKF